MVGPGNHFCGNGCDFVEFRAHVLQRSGLALVDTPAGNVVRDDAGPPSVAEHSRAPNVTHTVFSATDMLQMLQNTKEFNTPCGGQKGAPASARQTLRTLCSRRQTCCKCFKTQWNLTHHAVAKKWPRRARAKRYAHCHLGAKGRLRSHNAPS